MNGVLQPLRDPVHGERDKDDESNHSAFATAAVPACRVVVGRLPLGVDGDKGNGEPCGEGGCDETADEADEIHMTVLLADINASLEHECREWDPRDPGVEAERQEAAEDEKDNGGGVVLDNKVINRGADGEDDVENAGYPDEGLREEASEPDVCKRKDESHSDDKDEQDDRIRVQGKRVAAIVNTATVGTAILGVTLQSNA